MIEAMDLAMGRLLASLESFGQAEDTLVVFTSDTGGFPRGVGLQWPLRESKGHLYEGGIRVPMVVRWPGQVEAGSLNHERSSAWIFTRRSLRWPGW